MPARTSLLHRNLRFCTYDGLAAVPICYLVLPSNFIMAALLTGQFRLPPEIYGVICSLPFWGNFAQAFLMPFINRALPPRSVSVASALTQAAAWAALAVAVGRLPLDEPDANGRWFLLILTVSAVATAMAGVSWTSWIQEWVPLRIRGKYFGLRNRLNQVAQLLFLLGTGWLLGRMGGSVAAFQVLIAAAVALRLVSVFAQCRTRAGDAPEAGGDRRHPWRAQLAGLAGCAPFKWFVAFGAVWGFAANCIGPFYPVFMLNHLGLTVSGVSFLVVLSNVGGALSFPAWGALADRFGNRPVMIFAMLAWQAQNLLWCVLRPDNAWLLYGMWAFGGIMGAGFTLGLFGIQLKIIPRAAKTLAISLNLAVTALVTAIAPMIGGTLLQRLLAPGGDALPVFHALFLIQPLLAALGCLLLTRVQEVNSRPLVNVIGAMRNVRTLGALIGLGFLANHIFVRRRKKDAAPAAGLIKPTKNLTTDEHR
jgi:MFS family permease